MSLVYNKWRMWLNPMAVLSSQKENKRPAAPPTTTGISLARVVRTLIGLCLCALLYVAALGLLSLCFWAFGLSDGYGG